MRFQFLLLASLSVFCLLGLTACQSRTQAGGMSHAAVEIRGHPLAEVQAATKAVFVEAGYSSTSTTPSEMVFERPGSRRDAAKWGGWMGNGVTMRVKVRLTEAIPGNHLLQADVYAVQRADDPFFQTENRNVLLNRRPYQNLLNEVAKRLK